MSLYLLTIWCDFIRIKKTNERKKLRQTIKYIYIQLLLLDFFSISLEQSKFLTNNLID